MKAKRFKVITPAGYIYTDDLYKAKEYILLYGYPYVKNNKQDEPKRS